MAMDEIRFGGTSFRQLTGAANEHVRIMESAGVISPSKSDSGFRQFTPEDVKNARVWMAEHYKPRRKRA
jgi:hypothetical protein